MSNAYPEPQSSSGSVAAEVRAVRNRLADKGLVYIALLMPLALGLSLARIFEHGWQSFYVLHVFLTCVVLIATFFRKRLSYHVRAWLLLGLFLILGVSGTLNYGIVSGSILLLFTFIALTAVAFGTRSGMVASFGVFAFIVATSIAIQTGAITFSFDIEKYATSITAWGVLAIIFFWCVPMVIVGLGVIHEHLTASLQDLRDTHAKHSRLVNNLFNTFLYRYDTEGILRYVSSSVTQVLGYLPTDFLTHITEYMTDNPDNQPSIKHANLALRGQVQPPAEIEVFHKDGSKRWLVVSETPVFDHTGNVIAVEGVAHDITDRKRMEERLSKNLHKLKENEARLRRAQRAGRVGSWEWIIEDGRIIWSDEVYRIFGFEPDDFEASYEAFLAAVHPEDRPQLVRQVNMALNQGVEYDIDHRIIRPDGEIRHVNETAEVIYDQSSRAVSMIGAVTDITHRKQAEEILRESERKYRTIITHTPAVLWTANQDGRTTFMSPNVEQVCGFTPEQIIEGDESLWFCRVHPEDFERVNIAFALLINNEEPYDIEYRIQRKDGQWIWIHDMAIRIDAHDGTLLVDGFFMDVTERKQVEEMLRRSEHIVSSSTDMLAILDENYVYLCANDAYANPFGTTPEEIIGRNAAEIFGQEFFDSTIKPNAERCLAGETVRYDAWYNFPGARRQYMDVCYFPYIDEAGRIKGYVVCARSVTERKRKEDSSAAKLRLAEIAESLSVSQLIQAFVDEAEMLTESEIGFCHVVEEDQQNLLLQAWSTNTLATMCTAEGVGMHYPIEKAGVWVDCIKEGRPVIHNDYASLPHRKGIPEGHPLIIRQVVAPIYRGGQLVAILGVGNKKTDYVEEDIETLLEMGNLAWEMVERKRAEQQALDYAKTLEQANLELGKLNLAVEAANQAKSEFLANMSHEIRTPMTAILGYSNLILAEEWLATIPPGMQDACETIQRNGEHLLKLINGILDLSKIEAGKIDIEQTTFSPIEILADIASLMRVRAQEKNLPLEVEYVGPIPAHIQSDSTRLRQILINLIGNAIKFTEVGYVRLITRLVQNEGEPSYLQFDIVDTGIGMAEDQLLRLFEPFTQADTSTTRKYGGTGLGLAISKRLAEMLGGDITVTSIPGRQSIFTLTIDVGPLDKLILLENVKEEDGLARESTEEAEKPVIHGCRILLAEDVLVNQKVIAMILEKAGASVTAVDNGSLACEEALSALREGKPYDIILMDMQMPVMDGYEATKILRESGYRRPIIALTAHAMASDEKRCLEVGCDDYASKPVDQMTLITAIAKSLERTGSRNDGP